MKQMRMWESNRRKIILSAHRPKFVEQGIWSVKGYRWIATKRNWSTHWQWHPAEGWREVTINELPELMQMAIKARSNDGESKCG